MDKEIVISIRTVLFSLLFFLAGYVIYRLGPVFAILIIAFLIVLAVEPIVAKISKTNLLNKPISRNIAVVFTYISIALFFLTLVSLGLTPAIDQLETLFQTLSKLLSNDQLNSVIDGLSISLENIIPDLPKSTGSAFNTVSLVFSNFTSAISVYVVAFYMSLDWNNLKKRFFELFTGPLRDTIETTFHEIEMKIGGWVKGQLILMLAVGALSTIGLIAIGIDYPLALGIIAGCLEFIPTFGPFMSAMIAGIVGLTQSPVMAVSAIVLFAFVQFVENNFLVPRIMHKASGFSALYVLIAILVGKEFFGFLGIVLAIPVSIMGLIILKKVLGGKYS